MVTQALCWNQASPEFHTEPALRSVLLGLHSASPVLSLSSGCVHVSRSSSTHKYPYSHVCVCAILCTWQPGACSPLNGTQCHSRDDFSFPRMGSAPTVRVGRVPVRNEV